MNGGVIIEKFAKEVNSKGNFTYLAFLDLKKKKKKKKKKMLMIQFLYLTFLLTKLYHYWNPW